jgi:hypothetical protein
MGSWEKSLEKLHRGGQKIRFGKWSWAQMDKFYLIMVQDSLEEVASWKSKPALEKGRKHHDFFNVGCGNVFSDGGVPL